MLKKDKEEVEAIKHAKALEAEKAMYSVRITLSVEAAAKPLIVFSIFN